MHGSPGPGWVSLPRSSTKSRTWRRWRRSSRTSPSRHRTRRPDGRCGGRSRSVPTSAATAPPWRPGPTSSRSASPPAPATASPSGSSPSTASSSRCSAPCSPGYTSGSVISSSGGDRLRLYETGADGVTGQLQPVAQAELRQQVRPVPLDGLDADEQHVGDLLGGVTLRDELEDLLLAVGDRPGGDEV